MILFQNKGPKTSNNKKSGSLSVISNYCIQKDHKFDWKKCTNFR